MSRRPSVLIALVTLLISFSPVGTRADSLSEAEDVSQVGGSQGAGDPALLRDLEQERADRARLEAEVRQLRAIVEELRAGRQADRAQMEHLGQSVDALEARQTRPSVSAGPDDEVGVEKREDREYQQSERRIAEQRRGVLLPAGQIVLEPGFQYTNIGRNRVQLSGFSLIPAIIIGRIDVVEIDRDIIQGFLNTRYGITNWLEAEVNVPYIYRSDSEIFGATGLEMQENLTGDGLGDISGGLFAQVLYERRWIPDTVLSMRFNAPTGKDFTDVDTDVDGNPTELAIGSGFWGLQGGVTFTKTTDPAILFTSFRYTWNLEDDKGTGVDIDPGDVFEFNGGLAFALNERMAMSMSYQHRYADEFKVDGENLLRSDLNAATLFVGLSYTVNRWTALSVNVGVGITQDAPDLTLEIRMPLRMPFRTPVLKMPRLPWTKTAMERDDGREVLMSSRAGGFRY